METLLTKVREVPDDNLVKEKYYQARAIYTEIAEQTGVESPAKKAEQKAMETAIVNKKKADIVTKVKNVNTVEDFIEKIEVIEVEPEIIEVFHVIAEQPAVVEVVNDSKIYPEVAVKLAEGLTKAKTDDEIAEVIATV